MLLGLAGVAVLALAAPIPHSSAPAVYMNTVAPRMKKATYLANVTNPALTRDSCGSARVGDRVLWTCRDTENYDVVAGKLQALPIVTNTAAWTDLSVHGGPSLAAGPVGAASDGVKPILLMYGGDNLTLPAYFPVQETQCPDSGACEDGSRYAVWHDQPPLIAHQYADGSAIAYTWIPNQQLKGINTCITENPSHSLFKQTYTPSADINAMPHVEVVAPRFYRENQIGFGRYGSMMYNNTAYLYGQTSDRHTVLARVSADQIENISAYEYYQTTTHTWIDTAPVFNTSHEAITTPSSSGTFVSRIPLIAHIQSSYIIPNAGYGGQGTFYYSSYFSRFIWIGQSSGLDGTSAHFYITTAPAPEGPWEAPTMLFAGENGDDAIAAAYTLQAHPALLPSGPEVASENGIYVTWTQQWQEGTVSSRYVTPLVWLEFE